MSAGGIIRENNFELSFDAQQQSIWMYNDRRCHILQITDVPEDRHLFEECSGTSGSLMLKHVESGEEALERLRDAHPRDRPNLALVSWTLAGMTGEEFLRTLKSDPAIKVLPVIVFAPELSLSEIARIYSLGASCVIERKRNWETGLRNMRHLCSFWTNIACLPYSGPALQAQSI